MSILSAQNVVNVSDGKRTRSYMNENFSTKRNKQQVNQVHDYSVGNMHFIIYCYFSDCSTRTSFRLRVPVVGIFKTMQNLQGLVPPSTGEKRHWGNTGTSKLN